MKKRKFMTPKQFWENLMWCDDKGVMHFDAPLYAAVRHISLDEAMKEIDEMLGELLPGIKINVVD